MKILILTVTLTWITFNASAQQSLKDSINLTANYLLQLHGIELSPLFDTNSVCSTVNKNYFSTERLSVNDSAVVQDNGKYSCYYWIDPIQIVDSVDVTGDGIKEWTLLRYGTLSMISRLLDPFGIGNETHTMMTYEVWDIKEKKILFACTPISEISVVVSTNVIQTFGHRFEVTPGKDDSLVISGNTPNSDIVPGTYRYNREKGMYEKR